MEALLSKHKLSNIFPIFQQEDITINEFVLLRERDLEKLGFTMGVRKRLLRLMSRLGNHHVSCSKAPKLKKQWSGDQMEKAFDLVVNENVSIRKAATIQKVPFETLRRHVRFGQSILPGHTSLPLETETLLINWVDGMVERGFPVSRKKKLTTERKNCILVLNVHKIGFMG
eukprot:Pompholyxophrys_sp_v1_NODE_37_length_3331_cov_9.873932.p2 type:complete len:171 gc:universal NODE_37_length_3331_cov_9.873932:1312-1824(+)